MKPQTGQGKPSPCDGCFGRNGHQGIEDGYQPVPRKENGKIPVISRNMETFLEKKQFSMKLGRKVKNLPHETCD